MFLKSISINNFKSIQKATVSFESGLNILIGKNGAGKSNLLQFINQFVSLNAIQGRIRFSRNITLDFEFTISYEINESACELIVYVKRDRNNSKNEIEFYNETTISKIKDGQSVYKNSSFKTIKDSYPDDISIFRSFRKIFVSFIVPDNSLWFSQPSRFEMDETLFPNFDEYYDGFNITFELTRVIEMILNEQKTLKFENIELETFKEIFIKTFDDFNEKYQMNYYLSGYSPVQEIRINPNINVYNADNKILVENLLIDFKVNDNWVPWSYLSDGTKRLFYVITQCLSLTDGLLLIEEPELGIHPHQLFSLMEFIKEQSSKKQIIISTHSPIVLDVLSPDELNKINIVKLTKEGTQFYKLNKDQIETAKEYMSKVGDLSYYWLHSDLENE